MTVRVSGKGRGQEMDWTRADLSFETKGISVYVWDRECVARSFSHLATELRFGSISARLQKPIISTSSEKTTLKLNKKCIPICIIT